MGRLMGGWSWFSLSFLVMLPACGGGNGRATAQDGGSPADAATGLPGPDADLPGLLRIDYVDPDHGPFAGGTKVLLRGRGFTASVNVSVGGRPVEVLDIEVVDDRRVVIVTPPGEPGPAAVQIETDGLEALLPAGFRYEAIKVDPPVGSVGGGTFVTLRGFGTSFETGDQVTFDGAPMTGITVVGAQQITGYTPPGVAGTADVVVTGTWGSVSAEDAFTYSSTSDPFMGGLGGGPIAGAVNVTVVDARTSDGVEAAFVAVDDPTTSPYTGLTDPFGQITFSDPGFAGPVTITAAKEGYERTSFVTFDAQDVTIFLVPIPDPSGGGGPLPPGRAPGVINGYIVFGDATGLGTASWSLVPEPRSPTERKQARVFTSLRDPFTGNPDPGAGGVVEYVADGRTAWDFSIIARPAALAVIALAGLFDEATGAFQPFALGAGRGVLVGPGEIVDNVAVVVDLPLDTGIQVAFAHPPPLNTPGWNGPTSYQIQAFIDLGGEGVLPPPGNRMSFPPGATSGTLTSMVPLSSSLGDATYTFFAGAYTYYFGGNPFSVRVVRGVGPIELSAPIVVDEFLGVPRPTDPRPNSVASSMSLRFEPEGEVTGTPTFTLHLLQGDGKPLWRIFARAGEWDLPLYDLVSTGGLEPLPALPTLVRWTVYEITIPGLSFDQINYGHLNSNYWSAYAADAFYVFLPPNP